MPGLISGSTLRRGGSGQFIDLKGAQPQLPPSPTTSTGYTVVTSNTLVTTYSSSLGNIEFSSGTAYSNVIDQPLRLIGTGTTSVIISGGTVSTSTNTGALVVEGGLSTWSDLRVGGNAYLGNLIVEVFTATTATSLTLDITSTETSISTNTGALIVRGGVGIAKDVWIGGDTHLINTTAEVFTATTATVLSLNVTSTQTSVDPTTGALVVVGGVGIGDNLNIGTTLHVESTATFVTDVIVEKDVFILGDLDVTGIGAVTLSPSAASVNIQPTLGGSVDIQPSVTGNMNNMIVGAYLPQDSYFLDSHANNFIGLSTTATNIEKGSLGSIPYQTGTGTTAFIDIGPVDSILTSNGTTATWKQGNVIVIDETTGTQYLLMSTGTNGASASLADTVLLNYNSISKSLTTPNLTVTNTATVIGSVYSADGNPDENYLLYTPRVTISTTPPVDPRIGDFWINPTYGAECQYINDGGTKFWVQFTGF